MPQPPPCGELHAELAALAGQHSAGLLSDRAVAERVKALAAAGPTAPPPPPPEPDRVLHMPHALLGGGADGLLLESLLASIPVATGDPPPAPGSCDALPSCGAVPRPSCCAAAPTPPCAAAYAAAADAALPPDIAALCPAGVEFVGRGFLRWDGFGDRPEDLRGLGYRSLQKGIKALLEDPDAVAVDFARPAGGEYACYLFYQAEGCTAPVYAVPHPGQLAFRKACVAVRDCPPDYSRWLDPANSSSQFIHDPYAVLAGTHGGWAVPALLDEDDDPAPAPAAPAGAPPLSPTDPEPELPSTQPPVLPEPTAAQSPAAAAASSSGGAEPPPPLGATPPEPLAVCPPLLWDAAACDTPVAAAGGGAQQQQEEAGQPDAGDATMVVWAPPAAAGAAEAATGSGSDGGSDAAAGGGAAGRARRKRGPRRKGRGGGGVAGRKLFVGQLPKGMTDAELWKVAAQCGEPKEVRVLRDRMTGAPSGAGFITYVDEDDATAAIAALHGRVFVPPMRVPLQVRWADGAREKEEVRLFVGQVPPEVSEVELAAAFSRFGAVVECAVVAARDGRSRGCAFVRYADATAADAAAEALHRARVFPGQRHPLTVRRADTEEDKRQRRAGAGPAQRSSLRRSAPEPAPCGAVPLPGRG